MYDHVLLSDIADTNPDVLSASTAPDYEMNYLDLGCVETGHVNWNETQRFLFRQAPSRARRKVLVGDVLFGTVRPGLQSHAHIGRDATTSNLVASTGFTVIRAIKGRSHDRFLFHSILSNEILGQSVNVAVGSNYPAVTEGDVRHFRIRFPNIPEQKKIAHILDTLDAQILKTEAMIAKLEKIKEGLLHDLLTRGIDRNGQLRPAPEQAPELYRESALGTIPKEWSIARIEEVSTKVTNGFVGVATPHYTRDGSGILYLYGNNIRPNRVDLEKCARITPRFHSLQTKSQLHDGDMLTVQSGHIGTSAVYERSLGEANCHALIITRFKPDVLRSKFAALYCNSGIGMRAQARLFIGSTILHINTSDLAKLIIPVPPIHEQSEIIDLLESTTNRVSKETKNKDKLKRTKTGLMNDLLTGQVRVTPLLKDAV